MRLSGRQAVAAVKVLGYGHDLLAGHGSTGSDEEQGAIEQVTGGGGRGDGGHKSMLQMGQAKQVAPACTTFPPCACNHAPNAPTVQEAPYPAAQSVQRHCEVTGRLCGANVGEAQESQCSKAVHIPHLSLGLHTQVDQLCLSAEIFSCTCMPALPAPVDAAVCPEESRQRMCMGWHRLARHTYLWPNNSKACEKTHIVIRVRLKRLPSPSRQELSVMSGSAKLLVRSSKAGCC